MTDRFDWFAYAQQAENNFIERFADLDTSEHPDKVAEIVEAKRLRQSHQDYASALDNVLDEMRRYEMAIDEFENSDIGVDHNSALFVFNRQEFVDRFKSEYRFKKRRFGIQ